MTKSKANLTHGFGTTETEETDPLLSLEAARVQAIKDIETASQNWSQSAATSHVLEMELAIQMTACKTPAEALTVCGDWMAKRMVSLVSTQHRMLDIWLHYDSTRLAHSVAHQGKHGIHDTQS
jgi:hypothetical protein